RASWRSGDDRPPVLHPRLRDRRRLGDGAVRLRQAAVRGVHRLARLWRGAGRDDVGRGRGDRDRHRLYRASRGDARARYADRHAPARRGPDRERRCRALRARPRGAGVARAMAAWAAFHRALRGQSDVVRGYLWALGATLAFTTVETIVKSIGRIGID